MSALISFTASIRMQSSARGARSNLVSLRFHSHRGQYSEAVMPLFINSISILLKICLFSAGLAVHWEAIEMPDHRP